MLHSVKVLLVIHKFLLKAASVKYLRSFKRNEMDTVQ